MRLILCAAGVTLLTAACLGSGSSQPRAKAAGRSQASVPSPSASTSGLTAVSGCPGGRTITSGTQLQAALKAAAPGDVLLLAPGTYAGHFVATASGTATAPITLCGSRDAIIDGGSIKTGYGFHLDGALWWRLVGFTVQGGQKGVVTDHADHDLISGLFVHGVGDEGIHLRSFSSDDVVEDVVVRDTGLLHARFGEGIYVGSARANWCQYSGCGPDTSDRDVIRGSDIAQTTAENIDIKEGTTGGTIEGNRLSGAGMVPAAATAWVNVKGNEWTVTGNVGQQSVRDGFQVHEILSGWGERNVFGGNTAAVDGPGYGFYVQHASLATRLGCDNAASGAGSGLSNIRCT